MTKRQLEELTYAIESQNVVPLPQQQPVAVDSRCTFCSTGLTVDLGYVIAPNNGTTCGAARVYALTLTEEDANCALVKAAEASCCPPVINIPTTTASTSTSMTTAVTTTTKTTTDAPTTEAAATTTSTTTKAAATEATTTEPATIEATTAER